MERFKVRVILCSPGRAERLEKYFVKKLRPIDNPDMLEQMELNATDKHTGKAAEAAAYCGGGNAECPF